jgi:anhydro-N-acetylmuramic acid kinase
MKATEDEVLYIGLMSGTSLDGIDGVIAAFSSGGALRVLAHEHRAFSHHLRSEFLALNQNGTDELHRGALAANALAEAQAGVVHGLLDKTGIDARLIRAIGSHGQTVRHRPGEFDGVGYTIQLNHGSLLAERCHIDVVCDFRSRDVAAHGQGAPLVPAFHAQIFGHAQRGRAILNLGGIANLTLLPPGAGGAESTPSRNVTGFDCGPANALLDHWTARHLHQDYDDGGRWASAGRVHAALLTCLLSEPFLRQAPPKSTGRDLFNPEWLCHHLNALNAGNPVPPQDVQATLGEFTARCAADALMAHAPETQELLCCGGGALNDDLMARLARMLPTVAVSTTTSAGLPVMQVEAAAFAWLAHRFCSRLSGNLPAVTGALGPRVLGCLYPAG